MYVVLPQFSSYPNPCRFQTLTPSPAVAYLFVERLFSAPDPALSVTTALSSLEETLKLLKKAGFEDIVVSGFYEPLEELIRNIVQPVDGEMLTLDGLLKAFQEPMSEWGSLVFVIEISLYCEWEYLRFGIALGARFPLLIYRGLWRLLNTTTN